MITSNIVLPIYFEGSDSDAIFISEDEATTILYAKQQRAEPRFYPAIQHCVRQKVGDVSGFNDQHIYWGYDC